MPHSGCRDWSYRIFRFSVRERDGAKQKSGADVVAFGSLGMKFPSNHGEANWRSGPCSQAIMVSSTPRFQTLPCQVPLSQGSPSEPPHRRSPSTATRHLPQPTALLLSFAWNGALSFLHIFSFRVLRRIDGTYSIGSPALALDEVDGPARGCLESKMAANDLVTVEDPQLTLDLKYFRQPAGYICREMRTQHRQARKYLSRPGKLSRQGSPSSQQPSKPAPEPAPEPHHSEAAELNRRHAQWSRPGSPGTQASTAWCKVWTDRQIGVVRWVSGPVPRGVLGHGETTGRSGSPSGPRHDTTPDAVSVPLGRTGHGSDLSTRTVLARIASAARDRPVPTMGSPPAVSISPSALVQMRTRPGQVRGSHDRTAGPISRHNSPVFVPG